MAAKQYKTNALYSKEDKSLLNTKTHVVVHITMSQLRHSTLKYYNITQHSKQIYLYF